MLPAFKTSDRIREAGIIVQASWSPCGTYIACGTDDDRVYVYDHRFIEARPLLTFKHAQTISKGSKAGSIGIRRATTFHNRDSECCFVEEKSPEYGVTALNWLSSQFDGRGLVSGGSDGMHLALHHSVSTHCRMVGRVRLWDVRQGQPESIILAEMEVGFCYPSFEMTMTSMSDFHLLL